MKDLTKGKPSTLILAFALPIFFANLLQLTYSLVDTRIVGTFLGEDALAAVGATTTLSNLIIGFLQGLSGGFAIIIAQKFGAKDYKNVKKSFAMSLTMGTGIAIFFTVFGLLFLQPILNILDVPSDLMATATCDPGNLSCTEYCWGSAFCRSAEKRSAGSCDRNGTGTGNRVCCVLDLYGKEI